MRFKILTLGCKVNQYDSQAMSEMLCSCGFSQCDKSESADIYIINTCTVTAESDKKNRQLIHKVRRENPDAVIVVSGCMTQALPESADRIPEADIVIGNSNRSAIPELLSEFLNTHERIICIEPHTEKYREAFSIANFGERTRAMIKIEDGCDNYCAYCMIPYARGGVRSRSLESIIDEIAVLPPEYCEVVLVGINLSAYGKDIGLTLFDAVSAAASNKKIKRVRLGSVEPDLLSDETLDRLAAIPEFCPHFHLSLQSGCDETLARMNRKYDTEFYRGIVRRIREKFDNPSITTDIMVGFAGETEEEFEKSLNFAQEIGFAKAHVFAYSRRPGTAADSFPNQVANVVKSKRSARMITATNESAAKFRMSQVGRVCSFLPETEVESGIYDGYTENYTQVHVAMTEKSSQPVNIKITEAADGYCIGELVR